MCSICNYEGSDGHCRSCAINSHRAQILFGIQFRNFDRYGIFTHIYDLHRHVCQNDLIFVSTFYPSIGNFFIVQLRICDRIDDSFYMNILLRLIISIFKITFQSYLTIESSHLAIKFFSPKSPKLLIFALKQSIAFEVYQGLKLKFKVLNFSFSIYFWHLLIHFN